MVNYVNPQAKTFLDQYLAAANIQLSWCRAAQSCRARFVWSRLRSCTACICDIALAFAAVRLLLSWRWTKRCCARNANDRDTATLSDYFTLLSLRCDVRCGLFSIVVYSWNKIRRCKIPCVQCGSSEWSISRRFSASGLSSFLQNIRSQFFVI